MRETQREGKKVDRDGQTDRDRQTEREKDGQTDMQSKKKVQHLKINPLTNQT